MTAKRNHLARNEDITKRRARQKRYYERNKTEIKIKRALKDG